MSHLQKWLQVMQMKEWKTYMRLSLDILPPSTCFQFRDLLCWMWPLDIEYPSMDLSCCNFSSLFLNTGTILHPYRPLARSAADRLASVLELLPLICSKRGSCQLLLMYPYSCIGQNSGQSIPFCSVSLTIILQISVISPIGIFFPD